MEKGYDFFFLIPIGGLRYHHNNYLDFFGALISPCACDSPFSSYLNTVIGAIRNRKSLRRTHVTKGKSSDGNSEKEGRIPLRKGPEKRFGKRFLGKFSGIFFLEFFFSGIFFSGIFFGHFFQEFFFENFFWQFFLADFWLIFSGAQATV